MRRREFIALFGGTAVTWPLVAHAQQPTMPTIGFLSGRSLNSDMQLVAAFRRGLGESGYVEGENVAIEYRWAEGHSDRILTFATDLVERQVAVIFAGGLETWIREVRAAISTTPVVFATGGDPVALGLVESLNRPGGNVTAVTVLTAFLWPKRLEALRELVASTVLIACLVNPDNPTTEPATRDLQAAARQIGQETLLLKASSEGDFDPAFATLAHERASGLLVMDDPLFITHREKLVTLAAYHAVPAIYGRREFPAAGGLMSYGASTADQYYQSGAYVGRILKGAKPAELPVMQSSKLELVVNLKTASTLGLTIPPLILLRADEIIE